MDGSRIEELKRRLEKDPASIAFAQLAEEYRRAGDFEEAVRVCRLGLEHHAGYVSARVTLGRALIDLGRLEDAHGEFEQVLRLAPENLVALGAMADLHQRGVDELRTERILAAAPPEDEEVTAPEPIAMAAAPPAIDEIAPEVSEAPPVTADAEPAAEAVPSSLLTPPSDPTPPPPPILPTQPPATEFSPDPAMLELERWLASIESERTGPDTPDSGSSGSGLP